MKVATPLHLAQMRADVDWRGISAQKVCLVSAEQVNKRFTIAKMSPSVDLRGALPLQAVYLLPPVKLPSLVMKTALLMIGILLHASKHSSKPMILGNVWLYL